MRADRSVLAHVYCTRRVINPHLFCVFRKMCGVKRNSHEKFPLHHSHDSMIRTYYFIYVSRETLGGVIVSCVNCLGINCSDQFQSQIVNGNKIESSKVLSLRTEYNLF